MYAGGTFTSVGGQTRNRIAALDAATGTATAWNPNANFQVWALDVSGSNVYAGGSFSTIAGLPHSGLACFFPSELVDVPASPRVGDLTFTRLSPNPTRGRARISYSLSQSGHVRLSVYDVQGRLIARPVDEVRPAGNHLTIWEPGSRGLGLYIVRLEYAGRSLAKRLVVIR